MIELNEVCGRVEELFRERGADYSKSYEEFGISKESLKSIVEKKKVPAIRVLFKICAAQQITLHEFFNGQPSSGQIPFTDKANVALTQFRRLNPKWQDKILELLEIVIQGTEKHE